MNLGQRIAEVLEETGRSQVWLAEATGIDEGTISALIVRNSVRSKFAPAIAQALGVTLEWLVAGIFPKYQPHSMSGISIEARGEARPTFVADNVTPYEIASTRLPLISWVRAGMRDDANDPYAPGAAEEWIDFETAPARKGFALKVRGDSMVRPDGTGFPEGCIIGVDTLRKPRGGDFVVMRFNNTDEATFKMYVVDGPLKLLKPLNPSYPTIQIPPDAQLCGVVFEKLLRERF